METIIIFLLFANPILSHTANIFEQKQYHSGRTDKNGGHVDKDTGEYHKH